MWLFGVVAALFFLICSGQKLDIHHRIDCEPGRDKGHGHCTSIGCVEDPGSGEKNVPSCYFPPNTGYLAVNLSSPTDKHVSLKKDPKSVKNPFGVDFQELDFAWQELGAAVKVTISPKNEARFRPPVPIDDKTPIASSEKLTVQSSSDPIFSFNVVRQSTQRAIWNTSIGGLLFADQYIQIATLLPSDRVHGFGENVHTSFKHTFDGYSSYGMLARDDAPGNTDTGKNLYGVQNFYLGLEPDGKAHGVFFFNSNAQEITLGSAPHLIYRTIGGQLEFFYFPGPTPEDVVSQYSQVIGRPFLPPYWGLGFQLCRYGYKNTDEIRTTMARMRAAGIPQDVQFSDIDYMAGRKDFEYDPTNFGDFPQLADEIHNNYSMHLTLIFDPAIEVDYEVFQRGIQQDAKFIEWPRFDLVPQGLEQQFPLLKGTKIMLGKVWPSRAAAFPDFLDPQSNTNDWWIEEFKTFHDKLPFDGAWVDMNEPSNFDTAASPPADPDATVLVCPVSGPDSKWDNPPYATMAAFSFGSSAHIFDKTFCMFASTARNTSIGYNTKNLYGWSESVATQQAVRQATGKRGVVISRSTFASSGKYAGHWLGDNLSTWGDLKVSIVGILEFNLFGIPYIGADICGFRGNTNEELCLRWQQLGAFYSFSRNHNDHGSNTQDPANWPTVAAAAKKANEFRYRHLPYLYSLHFKASLNGGTVARPLFFEFPEDANTFNINYQFMWGSALMIAPVVDPGVTSVSVYLPRTQTNNRFVWYSVYDAYYGTGAPSGTQSWAATWTTLIPVFVRAGSIIPRQAPALTTVLARKNRFELLIALDSKFQATGELYWDDGDSIPPDDLKTHNYHHFTYAFSHSNSGGGVLTIKRDKTATGVVLPYLENIEFFGYPKEPDFSKATLNQSPLNIQQSDYSLFTQVANVTSSKMIDLNESGGQWVLQLPDRK